ncbi:3beta-hydroxysteroid-dehydrogenase/decarboxylase isoform X1 [Prunus avium]|uniref:Reticulon-like protein n=1 Tax=Prunus avium TaxID=42229 RepID=A0A6P5U1R1_PRUAV|nr:3beta-hydroxysteroid-dehydrogenase/decarboxylase isoform X1 [Prunus avium]
MAMDDRLAELNPKPRTCVVFGGRGFLGRSLVLRLLKLGKWIVRVADSTQSLHLDPSERDSLLSQALSSGLASLHGVDVRDKSQIITAIEGSSVVFYFDGADLRTDNFYHCYTIVVQGAKNVISACRECKVRRLIYNSSADVVFDGSHDINNGDESLPYPWKFDDMLSDFKAQAEALVLRCNDIDGLLTCALRPSNVFGHGDSHLVPFLVNLAKSGWGKFIIGSGENTSDFTYAENVTHAHICAEEALDNRMVAAAGKAFFITNLEPANFWEFVTLILEGLGYQRPLVKVPAKMAWYILLFFKLMTEKYGLIKHNHSMSAHYIQLASHTRTFDCTAARNQIGYSPVVSLQEGVTLTIESFSHLAKYSSFTSYSDFNEQSKVEKLLGSGEVADILLWRDEKKSFTYFLALNLLFYWFFLCGRTFASSVSKLLLLVSFGLYGYGILPPKILGLTVKSLSLSCFEIPEMVVKDMIATLAYLWNRGVCYMRRLAQGDDWDIFFKFAASLYFLKLISSQALTVVIGVALVFAFTLFFIYEQYESEIDGFVKLLFNSIMSVFGSLRTNVPASVQHFLENHGIWRHGKGHATITHPK